MTSLFPYKTAFVSGGTGFLGAAIIRQLVKLNITVTSFARSISPELEFLGVIQKQGDLRDIKQVQNAIGNQELILHVAAKAGVWGKYNDYYDINVIGTKNILSSAIQNNAKAFIYTSSPSVIFTGEDMHNVNESVPYPSRYLAAYPKTKAIAEQLVRNATIPTISLRPHLIWGPGDPHLIPRIFRKAKYLRKIGTNMPYVDTVYIDNAANAHILAAIALHKNHSLSGNVYFISQDNPVRLWEFINTILSLRDFPPIRKKISAKLAYRIAGFLEGLYATFSCTTEPPLTRFVVKEMTSSHWFNIDRAKNDLAYQPKIDTKEGLRQVEKWLRESNLFY